MSRLSSLCLLLLLSGCAAGGTPPPVGVPTPAVGSRLLVLPFREEGGGKGVAGINRAVSGFFRQGGSGQGARQPDWAVEDHREWLRGLEKGSDWLQQRGIAQVLTGRYQLPPAGFVTLELYRPPEPDPVWMLGLPLEEGESPAEKAREALARLGNRMDLAGFEAVLMADVAAAAQSAPGSAPKARPSPVTAAAPVPSRVSGPEPVSEAVAEPEVETAPVSEPVPEPEAAPVPEPEVAPEPANEAAPASEPAPEPAAEAVPASEPVPEPMVEVVPESEVAADVPQPPAPPFEAAPGDELGRHTLQVGVFGAVDNAERMVQRLRGKGYAPFITAVPGADGRSLFKVRTGRFRDHAAAQAAGERFLRTERLPVIVISADPADFPQPFRYGVQVGGFQSPSRAEALAAGLRGRGYDTTVHPGLDEMNRPFHRVWIGRFRTRPEAERVLENYRSRENGPAFITTIDLEAPQADPEMIQPAPAAPADEPAYAVQVGGFQKRGQAETMAERLKGRGFKPEVVATTDRKGRVWHFVWIGRFSGYSKALAMSQDYQKTMKKPALVVTVPPAGQTE